MRSPYGRHHRRQEKNEQRPHANYLRREGESYPYYELVGKLVRQLKACRILQDDLVPLLDDVRAQQGRCNDPVAMGGSHGMYALIRQLIDLVGPRAAIDILAATFVEQGFDRSEFDSRDPV